MATRQIPRLLSAALAGLLFGIGLIVAGMHDPQKVLGFLDLAGSWDPSLAFVMIGAIGVGLLPFRWLRKRDRDLFGEALDLPASKRIADPALLTGSLLFGAGWGLSGICPGPALVDMSLGLAPAWLFGLGMLGGFLLHALWRGRSGADG